MANLGEFVRGVRTASPTFVAVIDRGVSPAPPRIGQRERVVRHASGRSAGRSGLDPGWSALKPGFGPGAVLGPRSGSKPGRWCGSVAAPCFGPGRRARSGSGLSLSLFTWDLTLARHDVIADPPRTEASWCGYVGPTRPGSPRHNSSNRSEREPAPLRIRFAIKPLEPVRPARFCATASWPEQPRKAPRAPGPAPRAPQRPERPERPSAPAPQQTPSARPRPTSRPAALTRSPRR